MEREESYAVLRVRDSGIGISAAMLPRVFDLFAQADTSLDRRAGGLGIGLTIVKSLVERHGGNVAAFSEGPGLGSEFVVRLPLHPVVPAPEVASAPGPDPRPSGQGRTVLIVEDNVDAREALEHLLEFWGHKVVTAPDGETGLHRALSIRPDVMLLDVGLPGMDGYEVAKKLRSLPAGQEIYLVAMTGYGNPEDKTRALEAGFHVHLVKPVEPADLSKLLNELWLVRRT